MKQFKSYKTSFDPLAFALHDALVDLIYCSRGAFINDTVYLFCPFVKQSEALKADMKRPFGTLYSKAHDVSVT